MAANCQHRTNKSALTTNPHLRPTVFDHRLPRRLQCLDKMASLRQELASSGIVVVFFGRQALSQRVYGIGELGYSVKIVWFQDRGEGSCDLGVLDELAVDTVCSVDAVARTIYVRR